MKLFTPIELDAMYWAAQPPAVRALYRMQGDRVALAVELNAAGYTVDHPIMVVQAQLAPDVMQLRVNGGFTWVPNAGQEALISMPGADTPGLTPYDPNNPPAGSIMVVDPNDQAAWMAAYPPFGSAHVEVEEKPIVGAHVNHPKLGSIFLPGPGLNQNNASEGTPYEWDGIKYICHVNYSETPNVYFTAAK